jgi:hypothetical protein
MIKEQDSLLIILKYNNLIMKVWCVILNKLNKLWEKTQMFIHYIKQKLDKTFTYLHSH